MKTTTDPKWNGSPETSDEAAEAIKGKLCIICGSNLLLELIRRPRPDWIAHCNHCGSEVMIAVMLNRVAWKLNKLEV